MVADGIGGDAHLALPPSERGQGVLVLHPWWGLNGFVRDLCDRFAAEGFVALAWILYEARRPPTSPMPPSSRLLSTSSEPGSG